MKLQRRLAAYILKCAQDRVSFDTTRLDDIREAITKVDVRALIKEGAIKSRPARGVSRARVQHRRRGPGSIRRSLKKIKHNWVNRIRPQRAYLEQLRNSGDVTKQEYRKLYLQAKGGFFRNVRHIKLHLGKK